MSPASSPLISRSRRVAAPAVACAMVCALAASCRIPERLAPMVAQRMMDAWQSVSTNDAVVVHTPDRVGAPDKQITVRLRTRDVQKATYGYLTRVLAPPEAAGSASGGEWGSVWLFDRPAGSLFVIGGLRPWDEEANRVILEAVIRETFREYDFERDSGTWRGRETDVVTSTPLDPAPYRWKTVAESDAKTGFGLRMTTYDGAGRAVSDFGAAEYETNKAFPAGEFAPPTDGMRNAVRWGVSNKENLDERAGDLTFDPLVIAGRPGIHSVQEGAADLVGVVSDYTGPTESLVVVQWPDNVPAPSLPYAQRIDVRGHTAEMSLQGPYAVVLLREGDLNVVALGELTHTRLLEFVANLKPRGASETAARKGNGT